MLLSNCLSCLKLKIVTGRCTVYILKFNFTVVKLLIANALHLGKTIIGNLNLMYKCTSYLIDTNIKSDVKILF